MTLLTWMPVPGTTTPEPSPLVQVTLHARPSASSTEMCVVEPSLRSEEALEKALLGEALDELRRALGLARIPSRRRTSGKPRRRGPRSSSASE